jgi:hypothetical protein
MSLGLGPMASSIPHPSFVTCPLLGGGKGGGPSNLKGFLNDSNQRRRALGEIPESEGYDNFTSEAFCIGSALHKDLDAGAGTSVATHAHMESLDDIIDSASPGANFLLSIGISQSSIRKKRLQNRPVTVPGKERCDKTCYKNKADFLNVVKRNPLALEFASRDLCDDYEVVAHAIVKNGMAIQFASG